MMEIVQPFSECAWKMARCSFSAYLSIWVREPDFSNGLWHTLYIYIYILYSTEHRQKKVQDSR